MREPELVDPLALPVLPDVGSAARRIVGISFDVDDLVGVRQEDVIDRSDRAGQRDGAVTPERPHSRASDFISAMVPARAAAASASPDSPTRDESPMIEMMRPRPDFSSSGPALWQQLSAP